MQGLVEFLRRGRVFWGEPVGIVSRGDTLQGVRLACLRFVINSRAHVLWCKKIWKGHQDPLSFHFDLIGISRFKIDKTQVGTSDLERETNDVGD